MFTKTYYFWDMRECVKWKMKESETPTTSIFPWTCLRATMAGWNSIQGNSIQGRLPCAYSFDSLCKNYEKNHVWFSSHPKFKQNTSLSLFSFLVRGEMLTEIKKLWSQEKIRIVLFFLSSHVPLTFSTFQSHTVISIYIFICLYAYKHVHPHTLYIFIIYIILIYKLCIFDMYFQNLAFNTIWVIVRLERWKNM